jgi:hypothetical protein
VLWRRNLPHVYLPKYPCHSLIAATVAPTALAALSVNTKSPIRPIKNSRKTETVYEEGYSRGASFLRGSLQQIRLQGVFVCRTFRPQIRHAASFPQESPRVGMDAPPRGVIASAGPPSDYPGTRLHLAHLVHAGGVGGTRPTPATRRHENERTRSRSVDVESTIETALHCQKSARP